MQSPPSSPRRLGLADLPVELIRETATYLCAHCTPDDPDPTQSKLARLSQTCRYLHAVLQPFVFHRVPASASSSAKRCASLLRVLRARPDLAKEVRTFSVDRGHNYAELSQEDLGMVEGIVTSMGLEPSKLHWEEEGRLRFGWQTDESLPNRLVLVELILCSGVVNLEELEVALHHDWKINIIQHEAAKWPGYQPLRLKNLKRLRVEPYYKSEADAGEVDVRPLGDLLRTAPALEELYLGVTPRCWWDKISLRHLRVLEFAPGCDIIAGELKEWIKAAPKLEVLALHWKKGLQPLPREPRGQGMFGVWQAIEQRRDTLRELRLHVGPYAGPGRMGFKSLRGFEKLEVLKVNWPALLNLKIAFVEGLDGEAQFENSGPAFLGGLLPRGIREVTFWQPDRDLRGSMLYFAKLVAQEEEYPQLKKLVLAPAPRTEREDCGEPNEMFLNDWGMVSGVLEGAFAKGGVRFGFERESLPWGRRP